MALTVSLQAQYMPIRSTMSTPRGNIPTMNYVRMPNYYNPNAKVKSSDIDYKITFKNDSSVRVLSMIETKNKIHCIRYKRNGEKKVIYPSDTKNVSCTGLDGVRYSGIPTDTCWLFLSRVGKITLYNYLPGKDYKSTAALQADSGPIVRFCKENVKSMVQQDPEAMKFVEKDQLFKAIQKFNGWKK